MADMSLSEAAKWAGVTRATIHKAINRQGTNRLSAVKDGNNQWRIDPAELARHYQPAKAVDVSDDTPQSSPDIALLMAGKDREIALMRELVTAAEGRAAEVAQDRDHWRQQAEATTRLITHQQAAPEVKRGLLARITGR